MQGKYVFTPLKYKNGNGIDSYDVQTAKNLNSNKGITSNEMELSEFVHVALIENDTKMTYYVGKVSEELAGDIYVSTGLNIKGYNISVHSDDIRHIYKNHSNIEKEKRKGQIPINEELIAKFIDVYNKPDKIELSPRGDGRGRTVIKFEKRINGIIIVTSAISDGRNRLSLDTMYIKKSHPMGLDAQGSKHNVRNEP